MLKSFSQNVDRTFPMKASDAGFLSLGNNMPDGLIKIGLAQVGGGILMRCFSRSAASACICGVPLMMKARFWKSCFNHAGTRKLH